MQSFDGLFVNNLYRPLSKIVSKNIFLILTFKAHLFPKHFDGIIFRPFV